MDKPIESIDQTITYEVDWTNYKRKVVEEQTLNIDKLKEDATNFIEAIKSFYIWIDNAKVAIDKDKENIENYTKAYNNIKTILSELNKKDKKVKPLAEIDWLTLKELEKITVM